MEGSSKVVPAGSSVGRPKPARQSSWPRGMVTLLSNSHGTGHNNAAALKQYIEGK
jgi:hypothetical protein